MVRRVCIALLVTTVVAQTAQAQAQGTTGRGSFVGWLKSKVGGTTTSQPTPRPYRGYTPQQQQVWAAQRSRAQASQRPASAADVQRAVAEATGNVARQQQRPTSQQQAQYAAAQRQRAAQYAAAQRQSGRPQMTPQQQAQLQRARQYQSTQQRQFQFASQSRQVPTRTAPMTRLSPTPASAGRSQPSPVRTVSMSRMNSGGGEVYYGDGYGGYSMGHYPTTSAGLYSSPQPNIPYQVGMTAITNQALYPHEFLYPHEYKAIYPPYYYKVKGKWMVTPFGVWSHENWKPMGTEVSVKYRSRISPFSGFIPPMN